MKNVKQLLKSLQSKGFRLENGQGSRLKIIPPDKTLPFYSFHIGEPGIHPLRRFAKNNWGLDLANM